MSGNAQRQTRYHISSGIYTCLGTDRLVSRNEGYELVAHNDFKSIPEDGDCLGVVIAVANLARLANSGINKIMVQPRSIMLSFSTAINYTEAEELLRKAARIAGLGRETKD